MAQAQHPLEYCDMTLIFSGDEYYVHLLEEIGRAKKSIYFESYIFDADPIGLKILSALEGAALRGVRVRLLVDGIGSYYTISRLQKECAFKKIDFRVYHPLPGGNTFWRQLSWKNFRRLGLFWQRLNKRNHRKMIVIDDQTLLMGSFNISQVHSETYMGKNAWRDSGLLAKSFASTADLKNLRSAFFEAWRTSRHFSSSNLKSFLRKDWKNPLLLFSRFRLNSRPQWRFRLLRDLNAKMKMAKRRILVTNAYFIPRKSILRNLRKAGKNGVDVRLLLPEKTDVWFVRAASRSLYFRLLKSGVRIYEYEARVLHAKTLIVDDWATVGSHNLNHRSLMHDLEVEAVLTEPELVQRLLRQWELDLTGSREITLEELGKWGLFARMLSRILYWFKYWI